ncbi:MAG: copper-translocating P-type ATPase, partial [Clostridia bacterium]|nr:copper-translocating P-type ATPase [Clostridia bacterium]
MERYNVTGMSCAACSARVEKAVKSVNGVTDCSVNLLTNSMVVQGSASYESIKEAVTKAGYGINKVDDRDNKHLKKNDDIDNKETKRLIKRFLVSLVFLVILMYISMGHTMWNFPLPNFLKNNPIAIGITQLILCSIVMVINQKFFINGFNGVIHLSPNMDTLVSMGSIASFVYSVCSLYVMTGSQTPSEYLHEFYFESSAMILVLITLGKILESYSKGKTTNALKSLMKLIPQTATIIKDGKEEVVGIEKVKIGDIFIVRPGESVVVDGVIIEGHSAIDESAITGESIPIDKKEGDFVSSASINKSGFIKCEAMRVGEDTTLSQIIKMVSEASATKAPIAKVADMVSGFFVPTVIGISLLVFLIWIIIGRGIGYSLARAISVLVISCPCALGLATPVAIMVGSGIGAKNGILFKNAVSLENVGKAQIVVLDKTGTITKGEPMVTDIEPYDVTENELLLYAASLEKRSEHPLAKAILKKSKESNIKTNEISNFENFSGGGVYGKINEEEVIGGNLDFVCKKIQIPDSFYQKAQEFAREGKTPIYFAKKGKFLGIIAVADTIKEDSISAIDTLKKMGIKVVMLTGDNKETANTIGKKVGIEDIISEVKPNEKEAVIKNLQQQGKVIMVGDGINDAPALTRSDIGVAIGAGTDIAIESADVVLVNSKLLDLSKLIRLSKATLKTIHQNLFWAFIYNIVCIPIAAGVFVGLGLTLNPMLGAAAMSLSSFCVVSNALRLNLVDINSSKHDKKIKNK